MKHTLCLRLEKSKQSHSYTCDFLSTLSTVICYIGVSARIHSIFIIIYLVLFSLYKSRLLRLLRNNCRFLMDSFLPLSFPFARLAGISLEMCWCFVFLVSDSIHPFNFNIENALDSRPNE